MNELVKTEEKALEQVKVFENPLFGKVRTLLINNEPYFVGKDIALALGYKDTADAIKTHVDEDDKKHFKVGEIPTLKTSNYGTILINESGVYALVFGSKLSEAKKFKHWVTNEVLPSIRRNGIYATDKVIDEILNNPDYGIALLTKLKEERAARIEAERTNAILMHVNKTYTATEIAKEMGFRSAIELNKWLEEKKIQFSCNNTWIPTAEYSKCGYFEIKQEVLDNGRVIYHRRITQLGREFILNLKGGDYECKN